MTTGHGAVRSTFPRTLPNACKGPSGRAGTPITMSTVCRAEASRTMASAGEPVHRSITSPRTSSAESPIRPRSLSAANASCPTWMSTTVAPFRCVRPRATESAPAASVEPSRGTSSVAGAIICLPRARLPMPHLRGPRRSAGRDVRRMPGLQRLRPSARRDHPLRPRSERSPLGPHRARAASLLPETHIALLPIDRLYPSMSAFFAAHAAQNLTTNASNLVFITGPSRTADIEMIITRGVHGPKRLCIVLLP